MNRLTKQIIAKEFLIITVAIVLSYFLDQNGALIELFYRYSLGFGFSFYFVILYGAVWVIRAVNVLMSKTESANIDASNDEDYKESEENKDETNENRHQEITDRF